MLFVESVNVAQVRSIAEARKGSSGIFKRPVPHDWVTAGGLRNDTIVDTDVHGGPDQAVYLYARDDYEFWSHELGRELPAGTFGENLTLSSMGQEPVRVGDRYRIGDVELEITLPRVPCRTFAAVMGESDWVSRFHDSRRPGYYCRVISEGDVASGDLVERVPGPLTNITVSDLDALLHNRTPDHSELREALDSPIGERAREYLQRRLDRHVEP